MSSHEKIKITKMREEDKGRVGERVGMGR